MKHQSNTEVLGNCIQNWEDFYNSNFGWMYSTTLDMCNDTVVAKEMTERIMAHLVLSHPTIIANNDVKECRDFVAVLFPYLGKTVDQQKQLSAGRFLNLYYNPN